jgi:hypothetical protein
MNMERGRQAQTTSDEEDHMNDFQKPEKTDPIVKVGLVAAPVHETAILAETRRQLKEMGIECVLIPGLQRKMLTPDGEISGHTLMLHDLSLVHSLAVQEQGLGLYRTWGCGIFIPHKSIKEVSTV